MGFPVTGVDFIPELVEMAKKNAAHQGVHLEGAGGRVLPSDAAGRHL
jgi:2-polyprenyl-3-methyl-5-hydroxy-6-metoxy-1,4-benzoquinol methylase